MNILGRRNINFAIGYEIKLGEKPSQLCITADKHQTKMVKKAIRETVKYLKKIKNLGFEVRAEATEGNDYE